MIGSRSASASPLPLALGAAAMLAACDGRPAPKAPATEQEAHSGRPGSIAGRTIHHRFRCTDGREILVDFNDEGLELRLVLGPGAATLRLKAPSQGARYVGGTASAAFAGDELRIERPGRPALSCERSTMENER